MNSVGLSSFLALNIFLTTYPPHRKKKTMYSFCIKKENYIYIKVVETETVENNKTEENNHTISNRLK